MFRKDAIYRRMKYYSRENDKNQARVAELERRRDTCEAGLAALEACWTQVIRVCFTREYSLSALFQIIGTIRALVKPDDLPPLDPADQGVQF